MGKNEAELQIEVRDYECDFQGIVNNAVYQNYLEHARHKFLLGLGIDFIELAKNGINLVVVRAELDYKFPLQSDDIFLVRTRMTKDSRLKIVFWQEIVRLNDNKLILKAKITGTSINERGRPIVVPELDALLTI